MNSLLEYYTDTRTDNKDAEKIFCLFPEYHA